jgi:hypothetical protein
MASDQTAVGSATEPRMSRRRGFNPFRPLGPWPPGYLLLWIVALVSLVINVVLLRQLLFARRVALESVRDSIAVVDSLQNQVINYNVVIDQNLPINADIPINETFDIHIQDEFPINTTVTVSVPAGPLGSIPVRVPISTTVPIDRTIPITIDQTFKLSTTVPVHFEVPLAFSAQQLGLFATLEETKAQLVLLEQSLSAPLFPFLGIGTQPTAFPPMQDVTVTPGGGTDQPTPMASPRTPGATATDRPGSANPSPSP